VAEWNDIHGNGSGNADRDLCNGTEDIAARYVWWGTISETAIQSCIHHEPDDAELGMVYFEPWTNAAHDTTYGEPPIGLFLPGVIPTEFQLSQNAPNPFRGGTEIRYALPQDAWVELNVYDVTGRRVATPVRGFEKAGYRTVRWDARRQGSGVYFYRIRAGEFVESKRMLVIR
jgi:hypothetical protein